MSTEIRDDHPLLRDVDLVAYNELIRLVSQGALRDDLPELIRPEVALSAAVRMRLAASVPELRILSRHVDCEPGCHTLRFVSSDERQSIVYQFDTMDIAIVLVNRAGEIIEFEWLVGDAYADDDTADDAARDKGRRSK
jgi:hypothetical protein